MLIALPKESLYLQLALSAELQEESYNSSSAARVNKDTTGPRFVVGSHETLVLQ